VEPPKDKEDKPNKYFLSKLLQISMKKLWISLKREIMSLKKELTVLKKAQEDLSALNAFAKKKMKGLEKQPLGKYSKPVQRELGRILDRESIESGQTICWRYLW
jgi:hypothetical protein